MLFEIFEIFKKFVLCSLTMQWSQISIRFALSLTISKISPFNIKIAELAVFSKFRTDDLEVLSPNYGKAPLLSIDNITAKFEDATPCTQRYASDKKVTPCRLLVKNTRLYLNYNIYWIHSTVGSAQSSYIFKYVFLTERIYHLYSKRETLHRD